MYLSEAIEALLKVMLTVHTISRLGEEMLHGLSKVARTEAASKTYAAIRYLERFENGQWYLLTTGNYMFAFEVFCQLHKQYKERFLKSHPKENHITGEIRYPPNDLAPGSKTPFPKPEHNYVQKPDIKEEYRDSIKRNTLIAGWRDPGIKPDWW